MKKKGDNATVSDIDEDDLAMEDNRTAFLLTEFKPDLYQLAVSIFSNPTYFCLIMFELKVSGTHDILNK